MKRMRAVEGSRRKRSLVFNFRFERHHGDVVANGPARHRRPSRLTVYHKEMVDDCIRREAAGHLARGVQCRVKLGVDSSPVKKPSSFFACQSCGSQSQKWLGRCPDCGEWNSFVEEHVGAGRSTARRRRRRLGGGGRGCTTTSTPSCPSGMTTGISEFDRVLGGGIVPGSLVLLGGEPGIGKSTLLLQAAAHFATHVGPGALLLGRRVRAPDQDARRAARRRPRAAVPAGRDLRRAADRRGRSAEAGAAHRRLDPDGVLAEDAVGAGQRRPGAAGRDRSAVHRQGPEPADDSRRPRHEGRQPRRARRCSSTSSTPCCTSRASSITRIASCAR